MGTRTGTFYVSLKFSELKKVDPREHVWNRDDQGGRNQPGPSPPDSVSSFLSRMSTVAVTWTNHLPALNVTRTCSLEYLRPRGPGPGW